MIEPEDREGFSVQGIEGWWSPTRRLVYGRFLPLANADAKTAAQMREKLDVWAPTGPILMLVDGDEAGREPAVFRNEMAPWFRSRRADVRIGLFRAGLAARALGPPYALLLGLDMRFFITREEAEEWLLTGHPA